MAKQLYDYWFVQFDFPDENGRPYKSSGGEMVWNDKLKREIPKNWGVFQLDKLCSFRNGINYAKDEIGEPFPIVNVRNISSSTILLDGEDFDVITVPVKKAENYILTDKDIIIARSGCPGSTRLLQNSQKTLFCGFIICCTPYDSYMRYFLTYVLKGLEGSSATTSGGSILQNVSQDTLKSLWVAVPRIDLLIRFNKMIDNLLKQMCINLQTSKEMIKQRDELLPILMNGQVLVNSDLSVYKEKMRGNTPSFSLNLISDIQLLQRQSIIILSEKFSVDKFQTKGLIILVVIIFGAEVFVTIARSVFLEETGKVFQIFLLVSFEVAAHYDNAPVGIVTYTTTVFPETDV